MRGTLREAIVIFLSIFTSTMRSLWGGGLSVWSSFNTQAASRHAEKTLTAVTAWLANYSNTGLFTILQQQCLGTALKPDYWAERAAVDIASNQIRVDDVVSVEWAAVYHCAQSSKVLVVLAAVDARIHCAAIG